MTVLLLAPSEVRESLLVVVGRVLEEDALRGCVYCDCAVDALFFDDTVDEMVRVGVVIDSTDG